MQATERDARFADPAWETNPGFYGLRQRYLLWARTMREVAVAAEDEELGGKAEFAVGQLVDALAPTNFLLGNPAALKRAFETGGASVARGFTHFLDDAADTRRLATAGRHLDARARRGPRGDARQGRLPQPADGADPVRAANGDRVRDPAPVQPAVDQQVLRDGPRAGEELRRVGDRPGPHGLLHQLPEPRRVVPRHRPRGLPARGPARGARRDPGDHGREAGEHRRALPRRDADGDHARPPRADEGGPRAGPLGDAPERARRLLRAGPARRTSSTRPPSPGSSSAWRSAASSRRTRWPGRSTCCARTTSSGATWRRTGSWARIRPSFDILQWNADSTRMPARMHSEYLHAMYLENRLAQGTLEIGGRKVSLAQQPRRALRPLGPRGSHHAVAWVLPDDAARRRAGALRAHLVGAHRGDRQPARPEAPPLAQRGAARGSGRVARGGDRGARARWWEDWVAWIGERGGERREPPSLGSDAHPPLEDAPGSYVRES